MPPGKFPSPWLQRWSWQPSRQLGRLFAATVVARGGARSQPSEAEVSGKSEGTNLNATRQAFVRNNEETTRKWRFQRDLLDLNLNLMAQT